MSKKVEKHALEWYFDGSGGKVTLFFGNKQRIHYLVDSAQELAAIADILRNEKPVYLDIAHGTISTGLEPVGEEESEEK